MEELFIEAKLENIETVLNFVNARIENCPPRIKTQIGIVVDEILSNISHYAYHPAVGFVVVRISLDSEITIEFEDSGIAYDPISAKDPDITLSAEERDIGGLGLFMVKNLMDSVEYRRDGDYNVFTVKKRVR
ncbi:MAG: ATP-binding protein [Methanomicrobiales archaeon]|jgi:anti-sigma regulatory factor (Ser/Thr protein kinase)|nr:ATP-binding protein [Methanomicrobiales archaeon]